MDLPVTVRLLDPPLHEFLPRTNKEIIMKLQMYWVADYLKILIQELKNYMSKILC